MPRRSPSLKRDIQAQQSIYHLFYHTENPSTAKKILVGQILSLIRSISLPYPLNRYRTMLCVHRLKLRTLINNLHFLYLADSSFKEISLNCSKVISKDPKHHCKILGQYIYATNASVYCYRPELDLTSPYQLT